MALARLERLRFSCCASSFAPYMPSFELIHRYLQLASRSTYTFTLVCVISLIRDRGLFNDNIFRRPPTLIRRRIITTSTCGLAANPPAPFRRIARTGTHAPERRTRTYGARRSRRRDPGQLRYAPAQANGVRERMAYRQACLLQALLRPRACKELHNCTSRRGPS